MYQNKQEKGEKTDQVVTYLLNRKYTTKFIFLSQEYFMGTGGNRRQHQKSSR